MPNGRKSIKAGIRQKVGGWRPYDMGFKLVFKNLEAKSCKTSKTFGFLCTKHEMFSFSLCSGLYDAWIKFQKTSK